MQEQTVALINKEGTRFKISMDSNGYNLYKWDDNGYRLIRSYSPFFVYSKFLDFVVEKQYTNLLDRE